MAVATMQMLISITNNLEAMDEKNKVTTPAELDKNRAYRKRGLTPEQGRAYDKKVVEYFDKKVFIDKKSDRSIKKIGNYKKRVAAITNKSIKAKMDFNTAKIEFVNIMNVELHLKGKKIIWTEYNKAVIIDLVKYFIKDPTGRLDIHKGIYLFGPKGSGKDFLMHCFSIFLETILNTYGFEMIPTTTVHQNVKDRINQISYYCSGNYCYRNLGYEPKWFYKIGDVKVLETILIDLNENPENHKYRLMTSNYLPEDLDHPYDDTIKQLIIRNYNKVFLNGADLG